MKVIELLKWFLWFVFFPCPIATEFFDSKGMLASSVGTYA